MPLYEYQCDNCGDVFEVVQKFSDDPLSTHEKCGGPVRRLLSAPALQFKGSGFYITDYAKGGSSSGSGSGGAKKDESGAKSSSGDKPSSSGDKASSSSSSSDTKSSS